MCENEFAYFSSEAYSKVNLPSTFNLFGQTQIEALTKL